jgi:hypothetical protein
MICFHINVSTPWTCLYYMSNMLDFMDMFFERVHAGDMILEGQITYSSMALQLFPEERQ